MRNFTFSIFFLVCICFVLMTVGCVSETEKDLRIQNNTQRKRIAELESISQTAKLELGQLKQGLAAADELCGVKIDAGNQKLAAYEEDMTRKKALIASMQQLLLYGGAALPVELSTMLEDFAKSDEMVTYDSSRGIIKFKSDLLFEPGSDKVALPATKAVQALCKILTSNQAMKFDVVIAGHTDDMRIGRAATRAKHPTNWHLSANRAISVLNVMAKNNIDAKRLSVRGFGEYRPAVPNEPNKKGNPKNRRVEIYIVAKGM